jgi:multidrug transporter EmrE-like cation transporter
MTALPRLASGPYLLVGYALASSLGLLLIKSGLAGSGPLSLPSVMTAATSIRFLAGLSLYLLSFVAWIGVLSSMPLSTAYPLAIGLTMTGSTLGAAVLLGERFDLPKLCGIACVFAAVVLFTLGSRR